MLTPWLCAFQDSFGDGVCCDCGNGNYNVEYEGVQQNGDLSFRSIKTHQIGSSSCPEVISLDDYSGATAATAVTLTFGGDGIDLDSMNSSQMNTFGGVLANSMKNSIEDSFGDDRDLYFVH